MTREERRAASMAYGRAEAVAQGLPATCEDPVILARVARLVASDVAVSHGAAATSPAPGGAERGVSQRQAS